MHRGRPGRRLSREEPAATATRAEAPRVPGEHLGPEATIVSQKTHRPECLIAVMKWKFK